MDAEDTAEILLGLDGGGDALESRHIGALVDWQGQYLTEQCLGSTGHGPILHP